MALRSAGPSDPGAVMAFAALMALLLADVNVTGLQCRGDHDWCFEPQILDEIQIRMEFNEEIIVRPGGQAVRP
jgi:hypothetical protein